MASRIAVIVVSAICCTASAYFATIEWLLDSGKPDNIRLATRWMPWSAEVWRLMPQVEPERAAEHWRHVLQLAPRDTEAHIALALDAEARGQFREAEVLLLGAAQFNKGYLPAWTLANFYLRHDNAPQFWRWARRAATFETDLTALFELCLRERPDPASLLTEFSLRRGTALTQLLDASAKLDLLRDALPVADLVAKLRTPAARDYLLWDTDRLLQTGEEQSALQYWNLAAREHLLPYPTMQPPTLVNGDFAHASLERGFDWRPGSSEIPIAIRNGLRATLYGKQGDVATLILQSVVLEPGCNYQLQYRYRLSFAEGASPIRWQAGKAESPALTSANWSEATWSFAASSPLTDLKLITRRDPGTRQATGQVEVAWVRLARAEPLIQGPSKAQFKATHATAGTN